MDEKEFLKETIVTLRTLAALLITGIFGVCSFLVSHFSEINLNVAFIISGAGLSVLGGLLIFVSLHLRKMLNQLRRE